VRWWRILLGVGAILLGLVLLFRFVLTEHRGPRELLAVVREQRTRPVFDERAALLDLSVALDGASKSGDRELASTILRMRAEILLELGARLEARQTYVQALEEFDPDDHALELSIARMCDEDGDIGEASARVDRLIEKAPDYGPAWVLRGRILVRASQVHLEAARTELRARVMDRDLETALVLLDRIASLDADVPDRSASLVELRDLLGPRRETSFELVANLASETSRVRAEARHAFSQSLTHGIEPEAIAGLIDACARGGQPQWGVELGSIARTDERVRKDGHVAESLIPALLAIRDTAGVIDLLGDWDWDGWPAEPSFYETAATALYETGAWHLLGGPIQRIRRTSSVRGLRLSAFLSGMSSYARGQNREAIKVLSNYVDEGETYYPDDLASAWYALADLYHEDRHPELEREALQQAIDLLPDADGEAWLRLAQLTLQASNAGYREAETQWTRGMTLLPLRTEELMPQWVQISDDALGADRRSFDDAVRVTRHESRILPSFEIGPATTFRFGRLAFEEHRYDAAQRIARDLLDEYPGLLPAIDLAFETYLALDDRREAGALALQRLALVGRDEATLAELARVGPESFSSAQVVGAMRADPSKTGRLVIVRALEKEGRNEEALRALSYDAGGKATADPEQRLETARALFALGKLTEARESLANLSSHAILGPDATVLDVELSLEEGDTARIEELIGRLKDSRNVDRKLLLHLAEELSRRDKLDLARQAANVMDEDRRFRGGDVLLLLARIEMADGNEDAASEALARAEAFDLGGDVERAELLHAIDRRQWLELPALVTAIRNAKKNVSPLEDAIYALLEERLGEGSNLSRDGQNQRPHSVEWQLAHAAARSLTGQPVGLEPYFGGRRYSQDLEVLLRGHEETVRDPRELLALLLVLDEPAWQTWASRRIARLDTGGDSSVWALFLAVRSLLAMGEQEEALRRLEFIVRRFPHFGPAWDLEEDLLIAHHGGNRYDPEVNALRTERSKNMEEEADPHLIAIAHAVELEQQGEKAAALATLEEAFQGHPDLEVGREVYARLLAAAGRGSEASAQYWRAITAAEGKGATDLLHALLGVLRAARDTGDPPLESRRGLLAEIEVRFPTQPLVALARAELEIERDPRKPEIALNRAVEVLDEFRAATNQRSLDELDPGSSLPWFEFLERATPDAAEALLRSELQAAPGSVEMWLTLASFLEEHGRKTEALSLYTDLCEMSESPRAHLGAARLMGRSQQGAHDAEVHLLQAERGADAVTRAQVDYQRARIRMGRPGIGVDPLVEALTKLWESRTTAPSGIDDFDLGCTLARALFQRRQPADLDRLLEVLRQLEPMREGALAADYLRTLRGLAKNITPIETRAVEKPSPDASEGETATDESETKPVHKPKTRPKQDEKRPPPVDKKKKAAPPAKKGKKGKKD
jgi:tetratricopeptide (TPR) repeat protein